MTKQSAIPRNPRMHPIGAIIRALRRDAGLSETELGARTGVSRQRVFQWETDTRRPNARTLRRIARALRLTTIDIPDGANVTSRVFHRFGTHRQHRAFIHRLKLARVRAALSRVDAARAAKMNLANYVMIEIGEQIPNELTLRRLAGALCVPTEYLWLGSGTITANTRKAI